jgi:hypothetical protein
VNDWEGRFSSQRYPTYLLNGNDVCERDTRLCRRDAEACADGEHGDDKDQHRPKKVEPKTEPPLVQYQPAIRRELSQSEDHLIRDSHPVCSILDVHPVSIFVEEALFFPVSTNRSNPRQRLRKMRI